MANSSISMVARLSMYSVLSIILIACHGKNSGKSTELHDAVAALQTVQDHKAYLEHIHTDDQSVRGSAGQDILLEYGKDSKEMRGYIRRQWEQDNLNLEKIDAYLAVWGYPDVHEVGELAASTPWIVIHHQSLLENRDPYFDLLYQAYLDGNIDDTNLSFYLNRSYQIRFHKRLEIESPFKAEDEINQLVDALGFADRKHVLDQKLGDKSIGEN